MCGDISLNPGPVRNPCGKWGRPVAKNHRAVRTVRGMLFTGIILNVRIFPRLNMYPSAMMTTHGSATSVHISSFRTHSLNVPVNHTTQSLMTQFLSKMILTFLTSCVQLERSFQTDSCVHIYTSTVCDIRIIY